MKLRLRETKENLIYTGLWVILFLAPIVSLYIRTLNNEKITFDWVEVFSVWKVYTVYLAIFLIHNFIIAPLLIYKHRKVLYFATLAALLFAFTYYQCTHIPLPPEHWGGPPPHEMRGGHPAPPHDRMEEPEGWRGMDGRGETPPPKPDFDDEMGERHDDVPPLLFGQQDIIGVVVLILMLGMNLGVKLYFKNDRDAKVMKELEKKSLEQQLEYLKYQINPHFFMNTLNNIHALVDIDPEKAKTSIVVLSKIMRHVLYEGDKSLIPLQREIQFLNNYITLMRLRFTEKVQVTVDVPDIIPDYQIPPLMLITFVENAFKHGISYQHDSYIHVEIHFMGNECISDVATASIQKALIPLRRGA